MGPVQVLVVGFEQPAFTGDVLAELARLREAGVVRLVDVLVVTRSPDGTFDTVDLPAAVSAWLPPGTGSLAAELLGHADGVLPRQATGDDTADAPDRVAWSLADAVPPGTSAAVALLEHVWASPLRDAIRRAHGVPLDETWLAAEDLERLAARA